MGGNEAWLLPLIMGGLGAAQGAMGGGLGDPNLLETYSPDPGGFLDPRRMLTQNVRDVAHLGGVMGERAGQDVTLPGAFIQPTPWIGGGGLPFPVGVTGMDPALFQPASYQRRMGTQFAKPTQFQAMGPPTDSHRWLFGLDDAPSDPTEINLTTPGTAGTGYAPYRGGPDATKYPAKGWGPLDYEGLTQKNVSPALSVGGGIPQLMANLELLGVTAGDDGNLQVDPGLMAQTKAASTNPAMFSGTANVKRRNPAGPQPGTGLDQPQWSRTRPDPGSFT